MRPKLYLETTIPSYLTAYPSQDLVKAAKQQITRDWWSRRRQHFEIFVSEMVVEEASRGDAEAARLRLECISDFPVLELKPEAVRLARSLVDDGPLPEKAAADSLHIGIAVTSGMEFLLTWNCTHIANAAIRAELSDICESMGYEMPTICTPDELLEDEDDVPR